MRLQCVTRNLGRWTYSQQWLDEVAAAGSIDVLLLQEVPSSLAVPKGYTAFPKDLLPLRHQGHCRTVTLVADRHTDAVESASSCLSGSLRLIPDRKPRLAWG